MTYHLRQGIKNIPEICSRFGIEKAIISPGSRNAPLIFAFTEHSHIECLSITDERSAGYFAIGVIQQTNRPVAIICTSGTATLNFAPAIAEAYYRNFPLVVFTADRPPEMIDQADGQTLRQNNIYANYIKAAFETPVETVSRVDLTFSDRQVSQAIDTALSFPQGPVQINIPLREPVYAPLPEKHSNPKIIKTITSEINPTDEMIRKLQEKWLICKRKLVIFGILPKDETMADWARQLAKQPDVVVVCENLSNIAGQNIISQPESLFSRINSKEANDEFIPELLITVGHSVICKQLKIFLRKNQAEEQWQSQSSLPYVDTYGSLTSIVPFEAVKVFDNMPLDRVKSDFAKTYHLEANIVSKLHNEFVAGASLSDMSVTAELLQQIPSGATLQLANSTSVRWVQLFSTRNDITYLCNRGVSGIDGSLSTAAGYAFCSEKMTVLLTGDLSFIYDSNALWNNYIGTNLKIVVMNNNGGNIFRFIGDKELMKNSIDYFTTPHNVKIASLVEAYGLRYLSCDKTEDLKSKIETLLLSEQATVLEVFTDSNLNTENYTGYFENIKR